MSTQSPTSATSFQEFTFPHSLFKFPQLISPWDPKSLSMPMRSFKLSDLEKELLNSEWSNFIPSLWIRFLEQEFKPKHKKFVSTIFCSTKDQVVRNNVISMERHFTNVFDDFNNHLHSMDFKNNEFSKQQRIYDCCFLIGCVHSLHDIIKEFKSLSLPTGWSYLNRALLTSDAEEYEYVWKYCFHVLIEMYAHLTETVGENCLLVEHADIAQTLVVIKSRFLQNNEIWDVLGKYSDKDILASRGCHAISWSPPSNLEMKISHPADLNIWSKNAVLVHNTSIITSRPFISFSFTPFEATLSDLDKLTYRLQVTFCNGKSVVSTLTDTHPTGNSVVLEGTFGPKQLNDWDYHFIINILPLGHQKLFLSHFSKFGHGIFLDEWKHTMRSDFAYNKHIYYPATFDQVYVFPISEEEFFEDLLSVLEEEVQDMNIPANQLLIQQIYEVANFEFTEEEWNNADQLITEEEIKESNEKSIPEILSPGDYPQINECELDPEEILRVKCKEAKILRTTIIKQIKEKKLPKKQQPKPIPVVKNNCESRKKEQSVTKEEVLENLSKSSNNSLSDDLKQKAIGILNGKPIKGAEKDRKFVAQLMQYKAKQTGAVYQENKCSGGSHYKMQVVKKVNGKLEILLRETMVAKHGKDSSASRLLSHQRQTIFNLFSDL